MTRCLAGCGVLPGDGPGIIRAELEMREGSEGSFSNETTVPFWAKQRRRGAKGGQYQDICGLGGSADQAADRKILIEQWPMNAITARR